MLTFLKSLLMLTGIFQTCQSADLVCYRGEKECVFTLLVVVATLTMEYPNFLDINNCMSRLNLERAPLVDPVRLIDSGCIVLSKKSMIMVHGFRGGTEVAAVTAVVNTFLDDREEWNVMVLDWKEESGSRFINSTLIAEGYAQYAVPNSYWVGQKFGEALVKLAEAGLDMTKLHLVGHSLGAHVACFAGRVAKSTGYEVFRVIGAEPVGTVFNTPLAPGTAMDDTCGSFVLAIHTDPMGYGTVEKSGHVDVWLNHGPIKMVQPGCPIGQFPLLSEPDLCSHDLSWKVLCESMRIKNSLIAAFATKFMPWIESFGARTPYIVVGMETDITARGNYYLRTNSYSPYGMFAEGARPISY